MAFSHTVYGLHLSYILAPKLLSGLEKRKKNILSWAELSAPAAARSGEEADGILCRYQWRTLGAFYGLKESLEGNVLTKKQHY